MTWAFDTAVKTFVDTPVDGVTPLVEEITILEECHTSLFMDGEVAPMMKAQQCGKRRQ